MYEDIVKLNKNLKIVKLSENAESELYKKVEFCADSLIKLSEKIVIEDQNVYVREDKEAVNAEFAKKVQVEIFAELPIEVGWNYGRNDKMNGMEWHKSSEVIVACTDMVLLLGSHKDVKNDTYLSKNAFGLYMEKGEAVELYPFTLHLAPLPVGGYFISAVILPLGTNKALEEGICGARRACNKWLFVHKENERGVANGGLIGIEGENIQLKR